MMKVTSKHVDDVRALVSKMRGNRCADPGSRFTASENHHWNAVLAMLCGLRDSIGAEERRLGRAIQYADVSSSDANGSVARDRQDTSNPGL